MIEKNAQSKRLTSRRAPRTRQRKVSPAGPAEEVIPMASDEEIALRAYALWEERGRPIGSPDEDWHNARTQLYGGQHS
jgi:hypothetical protein